MKRPLLAIGLTAILLGLGAVGVRHESRAELQRALASFRANLPPDARFEYDRAYPRILARGAGFENARFIRGPLTISARYLTVNNPSGYLVSGLGFSRIHASDVSMEGPTRGRIANVTLRQLLLPPMSREKHDVSSLPPASLIHFRHARIDGLELTPTGSLCTIRIEAGNLDNYGHDDGNAGTLHNARLHCPPSDPLALGLSQVLHHTPSPLAFSIDDMHEAGFRLARLVSLLEELEDALNTHKTPVFKTQTDEFWEVTSASESSHIMMSALGMRYRIDTTHQKRWKDADAIHIQGTADHLSLTDLPAVAGQLFPDGMTVDRFTHETRIDLKTGQGHMVLQAETPDVFTAGLTLDGMNFDRHDTAAPLLLSRLSIRYKDEGHTIDTLIQRIAASQAVPLDQFRARLLLPLALMSQTAPGLNALPGFVENPQGHEFSLTLTPPTPLDAHALDSLSKTLRTDPAERQIWLSPPILTTDMQ